MRAVRRKLALSCLVIKKTSKAENKHGCTCLYETLAIQDKDTCILFLNTVSLSSSIQCSNGIWVNSMFNLTKCQKQTCGYNMCDDTLKLILYHSNSIKFFNTNWLIPRLSDQCASHQTSLDNGVFPVLDTLFLSETFASQSSEFSQCSDRMSEIWKWYNLACYWLWHAYYSYFIDINLFYYMLHLQLLEQEPLHLM